MKKTIFKLIFTSLLTLTATTNIFAEGNPIKEEAFNPTPEILHHIADYFLLQRYSQQQLEILVMTPHGSLKFYSFIAP